MNKIYLKDGDKVEIHGVVSVEFRGDELVIVETGGAEYWSVYDEESDEENKVRWDESGKPYYEKTGN